MSIVSDDRKYVKSTWKRECIFAIEEAVKNIAPPKGYDQTCKICDTETLPKTLLAFRIYWWPDDPNFLGITGNITVTRGEWLDAEPNLAALVKLKIEVLEVAMREHLWKKRDSA